MENKEKTSQELHREVVEMEKELFAETKNMETHMKEHEEEIVREIDEETNKFKVIGKLPDETEVYYDRSKPLMRIIADDKGNILSKEVVTNKTKKN